MTRFFHLVCWGYPLCFILLLGGWKWHLLGPEYAACTVSNIIMMQRTCALGLRSCVLFAICHPRAQCFIDREAVYWRFAAIFIPLYCSWVFTLLFYLLAVVRVRRMSPSSKRKTNKILFVPLLFVFLRVWYAAAHVLASRTFLRGAVYRIIEGVGESVFVSVTG